MGNTTRFFVTFFLGYFGVHKFLDKKYAMGILYLFTFGLFGIGWLIDVIIAAKNMLISPKTPIQQVESSTATISDVQPAPKSETASVPHKGPVATNVLILNADDLRKYHNRYIAVDVETTGLNCCIDRIVEISAVLFEGAKPVRSFSTLINPERKMPEEVSRITGITDAMLAHAPKEKQALSAFFDFVGPDVLTGDTLLVAHNATFDIKFLMYACDRLGIEAEFSVLDTLALSRKMVSGLDNYKLGTVAEHFSIAQAQAHRAEDDARVCGEIFAQLLQIKQTALEDRQRALTPADKDFCLWFKKQLLDADVSTEFLTWHKSSTYLTASCLYNVLRAKPNAKKPYILLEADTSIPEGMDVCPATKSEGEHMQRIFFQSPDDLSPIAEILVERYKSTHESAYDYLQQDNRRIQKFANDVDRMITI